MLNATIEAARGLLRTDPSLTPGDRSRLLSMLRNHGEAPPTETAPPAPEPPRILRRREAAARLAVSLRTVDAWSKAGFFPKIKLPGRVRAAGFREADLVALIEGQRREQP